MYRHKMWKFPVERLRKWILISKSIICQWRTSEPLKCPLDSCRQNGAYLFFGENVAEFRSIICASNKASPSCVLAQILSLEIQHF